MHNSKKCASATVDILVVATLEGVISQEVTDLSHSGRVLVRGQPYDHGVSAGAIN